MKVQAVVYKHAFLGFLRTAFGKPSIEIIAYKAGLGELPISNNLVMFADTKDYRIASLQDFKDFNVNHHPDYLINTSESNYPNCCRCENTKQLNKI